MYIDQDSVARKVGVWLRRLIWRPDLSKIATQAEKYFVRENELVKLSTAGKTVSLKQLTLSEELDDQIKPVLERLAERMKCESESLQAEVNALHRIIESPGLPVGDVLPHIERINRSLNLARDTRQLAKDLRLEMAALVELWESIPCRDQQIDNQSSKFISPNKFRESRIQEHKNNLHTIQTLISEQHLVEQNTSTALDKITIGPETYGRPRINPRASNNQTKYDSGMHVIQTIAAGLAGIGISRNIEPLGRSVEAVFSTRERSKFLRDLSILTSHLNDAVIDSYNLRLRVLQQKGAISKRMIEDSLRIVEINAHVRAFAFENTNYIIDSARQLKEFVKSPDTDFNSSDVHESEKKIDVFLKNATDMLSLYARYARHFRLFFAN